MMNVEEIIREKMTALLRKAFLEDKEVNEMREMLLKERYKAIEEDLEKALESEVKEKE